MGSSQGEPPQFFEARRKAADWSDYNNVRPHSALGYMTPRKFAATLPNYPTLTVIGRVKCHLRSYRRSIRRRAIWKEGGEVRKYSVWRLGCAIAAVAVIVMVGARDRSAASNLAYFVPNDSVYRYAGLQGPKQASIDHLPSKTDWKTFAGGGSSRLAILLTDPDSDWLGLAHGLKVIGVPFTITTDVTQALGHRVVVAYPVVSGRVLDRRAFASIQQFVHGGGTFVGFNVLEKDLGVLFGFADIVGSNDRNTVNFDAHDPLAAGFVEPQELRVRFGDRLNPALNLTSYGYTQAAEAPVARFDDNSAAILQRRVGAGQTYAIGLDLGAFLLKGYNNRQEHIALNYVNNYEPALDVFLRMLRRLYVRSQPFAVTLGTVPQNKRFSILISHDVDSALAVENSLDYARAEQVLGIPATYFFQTKYVRDYEDIAFFDNRAGALCNQLEQMGMEVASHSVSHSRIFSKLPLGTGREEYPTYIPFVKDRQHTYNATIMGELRISKFILEHFTKKPVVSFRPGYLSNPFSLPEDLAATGYRFASSTTADDSLTHLPFQLDVARSNTAQVPVYAIPITIEDQAPPRMDRREPDAERLSEKIARYGGVVSILIHPDVTDYKLAFERLYVDRYKMEAYFGTYRDFGTWWAARDAVSVDTVLQGNGLVVTLVAPERISGLPVVLPAGMHVQSAQPAVIVTSTSANVVVLRAFQGVVQLRLSPTVR